MFSGKAGASDRMGRKLQPALAGGQNVLSISKFSRLTSQRVSPGKLLSVYVAGVGGAKRNSFTKSWSLIKETMWHPHGAHTVPGEEDRGGSELSPKRPSARRIRVQKMKGLKANNSPAFVLSAFHDKIHVSRVDRTGLALFSEGVWNGASRRNHHFAGDCSRGFLFGSFHEPACERPHTVEGHCKQGEGFFQARLESLWSLARRGRGQGQGVSDNPAALYPEGHPRTCMPAGQLQSVVLREAAVGKWAVWVFRGKCPREVDLSLFHRMHAETHISAQMQTHRLTQ